MTRHCIAISAKLILLIITSRCSILFTQVQHYADLVGLSYYQLNCCTLQKHTVMKYTGCTKKNATQRLVSYFCSRSRILLFHVCFRIRILSLFHLDTETMPILNLNCLKNACADFLSSHLKCSLNCVIFASSVQTQSVICVGRHNYPRITPYLMVLGRCLVFKTINFGWD